MENFTKAEISYFVGGKNKLSRGGYLRQRQKVEGVAYEGDKCLHAHMGSCQEYKGRVPRVNRKPLLIIFR